MIKPFQSAIVIAILGATPAFAQQSDASCGITRSIKCDPYLAQAQGMIETGLRPAFPKGVKCRKIDEKWSISYLKKRGRVVWHGGIDIPAPFGTPMIAAADGEVIAVFEGKNSFRGIEVILRHSPKQTGLPYWTFSGYSHFDEMPALKVGAKVKRGQVLGPTGNSGRGKRPNVQSNKRRPAIHFSVTYSNTRSFKISKNNVVVPKGGFWTDPNAFLAGMSVLDTSALKALKGKQRRMWVGVQLQDGTVLPTGAKMVWPYVCKG
jgi:murein DD-endopeptidase MepM/ murein hydrolase activator NlpD